jgi:chemotaxis protein CheD
MIDIHLHPGDWFVGDAGYRVHTLLGSCVSIVLWHPVRRVGAMSHYLLDRRGGAATGESDGRYGEEALALLLRGLRRAGASAAGCQAKIFGGGNMFPQQPLAGAIDVGRRNGECARRLLRAHGIPVVSESLFGVGHRLVVFEIASGQVWSRQVDPAGGSATGVPA